MATGNYQGGDDIVLNGFYNGIMQNLYKNQANIQARQAKEAKTIQDINKEMNAAIGKINPNGVQQKDIPELSKKWEEIKDLNFQATRSSSPTEARILQAKLQNELQNASLFINQSKQKGQEITKFADNIRTNYWAYDDATRAHLKKLQDTPTSQLDDDAYNFENFYKQPDPKKVDSVNDSIFKEMQTAARNTPALRKTVQSSIQAGNKTGTAFQDFARADTGATIERMKQEYQAGGEYKAFYDKEAQRTGIPVDQIITAQVLNANSAGRLSWIGNTSRTFNNVPRKSGGSDVDESGTILDETTQNFGVNANGQVASVTAKGFVPIPTSPVLTAGGTFGMQDSKGKDVKLDSTAEEFKLVGVGRYPVLKQDQKSGKTVIKKGSIATTDYAEKNPDAVTYVEKAVVRGAPKYTGGKAPIYFANPEEVTAKVKMTKAAKKALDDFRKSGKNVVSSQSNTVGKPIKNDLIKAKGR